jgi:hypothetical protein
LFGGGPSRRRRTGDGRRADGLLGAVAAPSVTDTLWNSLSACLVVLFPCFYLRYFIAGRLFGLPGSAYLSTILSSGVTVWLTWHAELLRTHLEFFGPFVGLLPVVLVEVEAYFKTRMELHRDAAKHSGNRFEMPDGVVIVLPRRLLPLGVISGACVAGAIVWWQPAPWQSLEAAFSWPILRWPLAVLGGWVLLRLSILTRRRRRDFGSS